MARLLLALLTVAVTIGLAPGTRASSKGDSRGSVLFLEGDGDGFLQKSFPDAGVEKDVFSVGDTAAAVAVLLGVPPPTMLSRASSDRLNSVLSSNPFKRPHAVFCLEIKGITLEALNVEQIWELLGRPSFDQRPYEGKSPQVPFELSGQDVMLQSLNVGYEYGSDQFTVVELKKGLEALALFLRGNYEEQDADVVALRTPLYRPGQIPFVFDLQKGADQSLALELLALFQCTLPDSRVQMKSQSLANLFVGTFSAVELLEEGSARRQQAEMLFMCTAAHVLGVLQARHDGHLVGVFTLSPKSSGTVVAPMFSVKESAHTRLLLSDALAPSPSGSQANQTKLEAEGAKLIRRSVVFAVFVILLISTGLGSCFLFFMPLTRDTLLYASVKLD